MCKRVTPGERQAGPPRRSDGCGLGVAFGAGMDDIGVNDWQTQQQPVSFFSLLGYYCIVYKGSENIES